MISMAICSFTGLQIETTPWQDSAGICCFRKWWSDITEIHLKKKVRKQVKLCISGDVCISGEVMYFSWKRHSRGWRERCCLPCEISILIFCGGIAPSFPSHHMVSPVTSYQFGLVVPPIGLFHPSWTQLYMAIYRVYITPCTTIIFGGSPLGKAKFLAKVSSNHLSKTSRASPRIFSSTSDFKVTPVCPVMRLKCMTGFLEADGPTMNI